MKYTVTDVTTSHILVKFENESLAHVKIESGWDLSRIEEEISKYIPYTPNDYVDLDTNFNSIEEVPLSVGDTNDIEPYGKVQQRLFEKIEQDRIKREKDIEAFRDSIIEDKKNRPVDYVELRAKNYPPVPEQLDALYWSRMGDNTKIDLLDKKIKSVKDAYPKNMDPMKAIDVYPELDLSAGRKHNGFIVVDGEEVEVPAEYLQ